MTNVRELNAQKRRAYLEAFQKEMLGWLDNEGLGYDKEDPWTSIFAYLSKYIFTGHSNTSEAIQLYGYDDDAVYGTNHFFQKLPNGNKLLALWLGSKQDGIFLFLEFVKKNPQLFLGKRLTIVPTAFAIKDPLFVDAPYISPYMKLSEFIELLSSHADTFALFSEMEIETLRTRENESPFPYLQNIIKFLVANPTIEKFTLGSINLDKLKPNEFDEIKALIKQNKITTQLFFAASDRQHELTALIIANRHQVKYKNERPLPSPIIEEEEVYPKHWEQPRKVSKALLPEAIVRGKQREQFHLQQNIQQQAIAQAQQRQLQKQYQDAVFNAQQILPIPDHRLLNETNYKRLILEWKLIPPGRSDRWDNNAYVIGCWQRLVGHGIYFTNVTPAAMQQVLAQPHLFSSSITPTNKPPGFTIYTNEKGIQILDYDPKLAIAIDHANPLQPRFYTMPTKNKEINAWLDAFKLQNNLSDTTIEALNYIYHGWHEKEADLTGIYSIDERGKKIDEHNELVRKELLASWMTINNDILKLDQLEPLLQKLSRSDLVNIGYVLYEHGFEHLRLWFANLQVLDEAGLLDSYLAYKNKPIMLYIHGFTELADPESCFLMQQLSQLNENEKEWWRELSKQLPKNQYAKPKKNPYDDEYEARFYDFKASARAFLHFCNEVRKFTGKPLSLPYDCKVQHAHHLPTALERMLTILKSSNHPEQVLQEEISLSVEADYYAVMNDGFHFTCHEMLLLKPTHTLNANAADTQKSFSYKVSQKQLLENNDLKAMQALAFRYWATLDTHLSLKDFRKIDKKLIVMAKQLEKNGNTAQDICQLYSRLAIFVGKSNANPDLIAFAITKITDTFAKTKLNAEHLKRFYGILKGLLEKPNLDIVELANLLQYLLVDKQLLTQDPNSIAKQLQTIPFEMLISIARNNRPEKLSFFAEMVELDLDKANKNYGKYVRCLPYLDATSIEHDIAKFKKQLPAHDIFYLYPWLFDVFYEVLQEIDPTRIMPKINVFSYLGEKIKSMDKSVTDSEERVKQYIRKCMIEKYPGIHFISKNSKADFVYIYKDKSISKQITHINKEIEKIKTNTLVTFDLENCSLRGGLTRVFNLYLAAKNVDNDIAKAAKKLMTSMLKELMNEREQKIKTSINNMSNEAQFLQKICLNYLGKVEFNEEQPEIESYINRYMQLELFIDCMNIFIHNPKCKHVCNVFLSALKSTLNKREFKPMSAGFLNFISRVLTAEGLDDVSKIQLATYLLTNYESRKDMERSFYELTNFCQSMSTSSRSHVMANLSLSLLTQLDSIKKKLHQNEVLFNEMLETLYGYFGSDNNAVLEILEKTTTNVEEPELTQIITILIGLAKAEANINEISTPDDWIKFITELDTQLAHFSTHFTKLPALSLSQANAIKQGKLSANQVAVENEKNPFGKRDESIYENNPYAKDKIKKRIEVMGYLTDDKENPFQPLPEKQKTFLIKSIESINDTGIDLAKLTTDELIAKIQDYKKQYAIHGKFSEKDNLDLIALLREIYYRSGSKPIYLNSMQTLALVQSIASDSFSDRSLILNLNTGQGKGAIAAIEAAYRTICGKTVDFTSSNKTLIQRDFKYNQNFFNKLSIKTSLITERSKPEDYVVNGINFSEVGELALFRMQHRKRHAYVEPPVKERFSIVDEADHTHIYQNTAFICSVNTDSANFYNNPYQALYKSVYHYARYLQLIRSGAETPADTLELENYKNEFGPIDDKNTIKSEVQFYKNYLKRHPELWQTLENNKLPSILRINELIRSAFVVCELKEDDDFVIKPVTKIINNREVTFSMAQILDENQMPLPDSRWTNGIHQILHAKMSETHKNAIAEKSMPAFVFEQEAQLEGTTTAGNFSRFYGPHMRGYTATPGSPKLIPYYNGAGILRLPPQQKRRLKLNLASIPANEKQFIQQLIDRIKENPSNPQLVICGSIEEVEAVKAIISKLLPQRPLQTLTGKNIDEAESILDKAGNEGVITISNVLERGQDIKVEQPYPKLLQVCKDFRDLLEEEAFYKMHPLPYDQTRKKLLQPKLLKIMQMHKHKLPTDLQKQIKKFEKQITLENIETFIDKIERPLEEVYTTISDPQAIIQALGRTARQDSPGEFTPIINPAVIKREANIDAAQLKTAAQKKQVLYGIQHSKEKKIKRDKAMNEIYGKHIIPVQNILDKIYFNLSVREKELEKSYPVFARHLRNIKKSISGIKTDKIKELQLTWERLLDQYQENAFFNQKAWLNKLESEFEAAATKIMQDTMIELDDIANTKEIEGTLIVKECLSIIEEKAIQTNKEKHTDYTEMDTYTYNRLFKQSANPEASLDRYITGAIEGNQFSQRFLKNVINLHSANLESSKMEFQSIAKTWLADYKYIFISLDRRRLANSLLQFATKNQLNLAHIHNSILKTFDDDKTRRRVKDSDLRNVLWQLEKLYYVKVGFDTLLNNMESEKLLLLKTLRHCSNDLKKNNKDAANNIVANQIFILETSTESFTDTLPKVVFALKQVHDMMTDKKVKAHYAKMIEHYEWLSHAFEANMKLDLAQTNPALPLAKIKTKFEQSLKTLKQTKSQQKYTLWNRKPEPVNDPIINIQFGDDLSAPIKNKLIPAFNSLVSILGKYIDHRDIHISQEATKDADAYVFNIQFIHAGQAYKMEIAIDENLNVNFLTDFVPEKSARLTQAKW